jgi:hypothetical protein
MPTYTQPGSDHARIAFLNSALGAADSDTASGNDYILEDTYKTLQTFAPEYEKKVTTITKNLSARSKEIEERNSALSILSTYTRDGFEVARRQANRHNLPAHVLQLYGLPLDGKTPYPATPAEWITIARTFVEGAKNVKEQGFPVVRCPSANSIEEKLEIAQKEYDDVAAADRGYDDAQSGIAEMRAKADELIGDIMAELRLTLRKLDQPSQRRIQRSYGAKFKYLKGESVDPDDNDPIVDDTQEQPAAE